LGTSDTPTFEEFAAAELPRMLGLARAITPNAHDAWDLVNDTLAKAALRWRSIERGSNPGVRANDAGPPQHRPHPQAAARVAHLAAA
jgi:hypothetical protein